MSRLGATVAEMYESRERARMDRWQRERVDRAIRDLDRLVEAIEHLNLSDRARVPMAWQPRLARMAAQLPVESGDRLRAGISPLRLLDQVYDIQQELLWLKQGESAGGFRDVDSELEAAPN
jgi:hypothetical protein